MQFHEWLKCRVNEAENVDLSAAINQLIEYKIRSQEIMDYITSRASLHDPKLGGAKNTFAKLETSGQLATAIHENIISIIKNLKRLSTDSHASASILESYRIITRSVFALRNSTVQHGVMELERMADYIGNLLRMLKIGGS